MEAVTAVVVVLNKIIYQEVMLIRSFFHWSPVLVEGMSC